MADLTVAPSVRPAAPSLERAVRRLTTPTAYLAAIGGFQVALLWVLTRRFGIVIPVLATLVLCGLLGSLARPGWWRWKLGGLCTLVAITTVAPTVASMALRAQVGSTIEHDGLIQTEAAIDRLLAGRPIYGVDWSDTDVARYPWDLTPGPNPAIHHNAYFPMTMLAGVPFRLAARAAGFPFDYRAVLIAFLMAGLAAVLWLPIPAPRRLMIATALFANPSIVLFFWTGRNDIAYVSALLVGLALLARGHAPPAAFAVGIAAALKPFAVLAVPLFALGVWFGWRRQLRPHLREAAVIAVGLLAPLALSVLPFLYADPAAFVRDTLLYAGGGLSDSYPIAGYGFGALLLALGLIAQRTDAFPFTVFQLAAMLPALWYGAKGMAHRQTLGRWMRAYVLVFVAFGFFARFFNDNYVGVAMALAACILPLGDAPLLPPAVRDADQPRWQ